MRQPRPLPRNLLVVLTFCLMAFGVILPVNPAALAQTPPTPAPILLPLIENIGSETWMGPDGGSVVCMAVDPTDLDPSPDQRTVYAGTLRSGIYKSTNGGRAWKSVSSGLGKLFIDSVTVDPVTGTTLYTGTHGMGVYKSTNGGASWFPVNNGIAANSVVYSVVVNPGNHSLVYAATRIEDTQYHGVLYKSNNAGASWQKVMEFSDDWVYSVAVDPSSPNTVLAAVHTRGPRISYDYGNAGTWNDTTPPPLDAFLAGRWTKGRAVAFDPRGWMNRAYYTAWHDGMVSYSADGGETWDISDGSMGTSHVYPNGISVKPDLPDVVYLAVHEGNVGGVLRSSDAGESFRGVGLTGKTIYSVAALGGGGDTLLAGTYLDGLHRSTNGGASWTYYSMSGIHDSRVTGMVFPGNNEVYASTTSGGGVFKSTNGGSTWKRFATGLGDNMVNGLVLHPTQPNILFALTKTAGLKRIDLSTSTTWVTVGAPPRTPGAAEHETDGPFAPPLPPDEVFGEEEPGDTTDSPSTPQFLDPELLDPSQPQLAASVTDAEVTSMAFAPTSAGIAYFGTNGDGVYSSSDGGASWAYAGQPGGNIRSLAVSRSSARTVYAATNKAGLIYRSTSGSATWSSIALPSSTLSVYSLAILPDDSGSVYAGTSKGVYRYRSGAWEQVGLSTLPVYQLSFHPAAPQLIFAGTTRGAYHSTLSTLPTWTPVSSQLSQEEVVSLNFDPASRREIYIGTNGRGTLKVFLP